MTNLRPSTYIKLDCTCNEPLCPFRNDYYGRADLDCAEADNGKRCKYLDSTWIEIDVWLEQKAKLNAKQLPDGFAERRGNYKEDK